jgi:hypothetical protein
VSFRSFTRRTSGFCGWPSDLECNARAS